MIRPVTLRQIKLCNSQADSESAEQPFVINSLREIRGRLVPCVQRRSLCADYARPTLARVITGRVCSIWRPAAFGRPPLNTGTDGFNSSRNTGLEK
jgi:hypothetical protein